MTFLRKIALLARHPREVRLALSGILRRLDGDTALGGLTEEELDALARWIGEAGGKALTVVEVGTLFGFTAREIVRRTGARVIAVDNWSWNPFGLDPESHARFARRVLADLIADGRVELVTGDGAQALSRPGAAAKADFVFLDGDHRYPAVKREIERARAAGVTWLAGHDYGNPNPVFGVTAAVDGLLGGPDATAGMCWVKRLKGSRG